MEDSVGHIEEEQIKARTAYLNSIASGGTVASVIVPAVGFSLGLWVQSSTQAILGLLTCAVWLLISYVLHVYALKNLERLDEHG
jgi:hypothetical protein